MAGGNDEFKKNLAKATASMREGAVTAVKLSVALIKTESQKKTPVDLGNLKAGHYGRTHRKAKSVVGEVGAVAEYAIYVHEDLEAHHPTGEAKFLERAIDESRPKIRDILKKFIKFK